MKKVNFIYPDLYLASEIAIIGSSGILKTAKYGQEIDSYNDVVRFNRAPTEGFEDIAGSKRTLTVANRHVFANKQLNKKSGWKQDNPDFIKELKHSKILYFARPSKVWEDREKNIDVTSQAYKVNGYQKMLEVIKYPRKIPSVGYGFICICVNSGIFPHLYGFDVEVRPRDHYWENRDGLATHNINYEMNSLIKLDKEKKIKIHL